MATYKEQLEVVLAYHIKEGGSYRGNCPFCSGRNTFGIAKRSGNLKWGCFKASCDVGGVSGGDMSIEAAKVHGTHSSVPTVILAPVPPILTPVENQPGAMAWLKSVNSISAYESGLVSIKYAPTEDRVMFPVLTDREPIGYTGRARKGVKPKWKKYGDCSSLFSCGKGEIAVVVEDAPSACAVGIIPAFTGVSLLGTKLSLQHKVELRRFKKVLVCLDRDAMQLGLKMVRELRGTVDTSMRMIPDDLKYFGPDEIERILNND